MAPRTNKPGDAPEKGARPRGRPKLTIDRDAVADAAAELFAEAGYEAVSIINTADKLGVSRATLYRTVPTKEDLLGILFERSTSDLTARARAVIRSTEDPREQLAGLIRLQADAAVQMRGYMSVFFGSSQLPPEVVGRWRKWSRKYEAMWAKTVEANITAGNLDGGGDPRTATRLILGMLIWVSRWYRPTDNLTSEQVAEVATGLLRLAEVPKKRSTSKAGSNGQRRTKRS